MTDSRQKPVRDGSLESCYYRVGDFYCTNSQSIDRQGIEDPYPGYEAHDESADISVSSPGRDAEDGLLNPMEVTSDLILDQRLLASSRVNDWPDPNTEVDSEPWADIYRRVKSTGLPKEVKTHAPVKTKLNLELWYDIATGHNDDHIVLNGITYGFSLQYLGGPLHENDIEMHSSGEKHIDHIQEYLDTELRFGAIAGPFQAPPFKQWTHTSPIMTRPKTESSHRRIIIDLSYPEDNNVNSSVVKNNYYGQVIQHTLPKIEDVIEFVETKGFNMALATIDIKRAYRNFPGCPLDYPLNALKFKAQYYLDLAMPFGARTSSAYMQKIANMISRALVIRGIDTKIYLDDVILFFLPGHDPPARMKEAVDFMKALGLPLAEEKMQQPASKACYLGIWLDVKERLITMPNEKIVKFLEMVDWVIQQDRVSKKVVQSLIGKIIHFSACVPAARTFINRILMTLRAAHESQKVTVSSRMRADLKWFKRFLKKYNGKSIMKSNTPKFTIEADACLVGGGATDFNEYIAYQFPEKTSVFHISILEALNCLAACRAFLTSEKHSSTVLIKCDNVAAMESLSKGTARDNFLAAISRAAWYCMARADVKPIYKYTPGQLLTIPDALSRMSISPAQHEVACSIIQRLKIREKRFYSYYLDFHDFL